MHNICIKAFLEKGKVILALKSLLYLKSNYEKESKKADSTSPSAYLEYKEGYSRFIEYVSSNNGNNIETKDKINENNLNFIKSKIDLDLKAVLNIKEENIDKNANSIIFEIKENLRKNENLKGKVLNIIDNFNKIDKMSSRIIKSDVHILKVNQIFF